MELQKKSCQVDLERVAINAFYIQLKISRGKLRFVLLKKEFTLLLLFKLRWPKSAIGIASPSNDHGWFPPANLCPENRKIFFH